MKKYTIFRFLALMVLALPLACVREAAIDDARQQPEKGDLITIHATLEQGLTKTSLDAAYAVVWNAGDQILVFNETNPYGSLFTLDAASAGSVKGTFSGEELSGSGPFYAVYPASAARVPFTPGSIPVTVPEAQVFTAPGTFGQGTNMAVGIAATLDEIQFKNVCGLVELPMEGDASVSKITLVSDNGEPLAGTGTVNVSLSEAPSISWDNGASSLSLTFATPEPLSGGKIFYLVVPAGSFAQGFSVEVLDAEGGAMFKHASGDGTNVIERSVIRPMPTITYAAECSSAWLALGQAGVYSGIMPGASLQRTLVWSEEAGQYGWQKGESALTLRIQDWNAGYALSLSFSGATLVGGRQYTATIKALGETAGIDSGDVTLKVIKKADGLCWLTDGTNGYIMKTEED